MTTKTIRPAAAAPAVHTLSDHPDFAAAKEKSDELHSHLRRQQKALDEIIKLRNSRSTGSLLDGEASALISGVEMTPDERLTINPRSIEHSIEVAKRAIAIHDEELTRVRSRVQRELRTERVAEHRRIQARLIAAAEQLAAAGAEEIAFRDSLERDDLGWGFPLQALGNIKLFGSGFDPQGLLAAWLDELRAAYQK